MFWDSHSHSCKAFRKWTRRKVQRYCCQDGDGEIQEGWSGRQRLQKARGSAPFIHMWTLTEHLPCSGYCTKHIPQTPSMKPLRTMTEGRCMETRAPRDYQERRRYPHVHDRREQDLRVGLTRVCVPGPSLSMSGIRFIREKERGEVGCECGQW